MKEQHWFKEYGQKCSWSSPKDKNHVLPASWKNTFEKGLKLAEWILRLKVSWSTPKNCSAFQNQLRRDSSITPCNWSSQTLCSSSGKASAWFISCKISRQSTQWHFSAWHPHAFPESGDDSYLMCLWCCTRQNPPFPVPWTKTLEFK